MIRCEGCGAEHEPLGPSPLMCWCGHRTSFDDSAVSIPIASSCAIQVKQQGEVGKELSGLIPKLFASQDCDCEAYAAKMDRWGIAGCEQRFEEIVNHLVAQASKKPIIKYFPSFSREVANQWLTKAIDQAREKVRSTATKSCSVVWVYWAAGAEGEELRYSLRSAMDNVLDARNFVICGDVPSWFMGDRIDSPRVTKSECQQRFGSSRWQKWVDSITKLKRIVASPLVSDRFLWMYDDTFIVRSTTVDWLATPRAGGDLAKLLEMDHRSKWRDCLARTVQALQGASFPTRNFSTHYPVVYEKAKLAAVIEEFEADCRPRAIESLYLNRYFSNAASVAKVFQYNKSITDSWRINKEAIVVNVGGFKTPVARVMAERFPDPCQLEQSAAQTSLKSIA